MIIAVDGEQGVEFEILEGGVELVLLIIAATLVRFDVVGAVHGIHNKKLM